VERDFVRHDLDRLWFGDLTDTCSRRLLGWSILWSR
jgi:hypothetical protein